MRIACVHVPQFALQTLTRIDPTLRGAPVAVVGAGLDRSAASVLAPRLSTALTSPIVQACSRAAWALGIRLGMTATAAHALAPGQLRVVTADALLERETVRAIADALLGASAVVDVGGRVGTGAPHLAMYCEVPSKTRGTSFGDRLLELLATLGLTARIGIADDRFTAWVAAAHGGREAASLEDGGVVSVPRGGSAAFLSPRPLSLLAITPEVQHMLEALGVRTLGEFAALPAPSARTRPLSVEADYQALARGDSGSALRPYAPEAPIREELAIGGERSAGASSGAAAVATLAGRIATRLVGRGRGAARLEVTIAGPSGERVVSISPLMAPATGHVLEEAEELAEAIGRAIGEELATASRLRVAVVGEAIAGEATELAGAPAPASSAIDALSVVLATTGSGSWQLTAPSSSGPSLLRSERRDAHRRTRRGKQHRRVRGGEAGAALVQPRLFADRK